MSPAQEGVSLGITILSYTNKIIQDLLELLNPHCLMKPAA